MLATEHSGAGSPRLAGASSLKHNSTVEEAPCKVKLNISDQCMCTRVQPSHDVTSQPLPCLLRQKENE